MGIHSSILIEEQFKRNYDEEPEVNEGAEISEEQRAEEEAIRLKIEEEEFSNEER